MKNQNEMFIVEHENGEWADATGDGGWSCWTTRGEAQDALDSEADNCEDPRTAYRVVRFVRVAARPCTCSTRERYGDCACNKTEQALSSGASE